MREDSDFCRLCAEKIHAGEICYSVFDNNGTETILGRDIRTKLQITIPADDSLPKKVCKPCAVEMIKVCEFIESCKDAQERLKKEMLVSACRLRAEKIHTGQICYSIFDNDGTETLLGRDIRTKLQITISADDLLPNKVCKPCAVEMIKVCEFIESCKDALDHLKDKFKDKDMEMFVSVDLSDITNICIDDDGSLVDTIFLPDDERDVTSVEVVTCCFETLKSTPTKKNENEGSEAQATSNESDITETVNEILAERTIENMILSEDEVIETSDGALENESTNSDLHYEIKDETENPKPKNQPKGTDEVPKKRGNIPKKTNNNPRQRRKRNGNEGREAQETSNESDITETVNEILTERTIENMILLQDEVIETCDGAIENESANNDSHSEIKDETENPKPQNRPKRTDKMQKKREKVPKKRTKPEQRRKYECYCCDDLVTYHLTKFKQHVRKHDTFRCKHCGKIFGNCLCLGRHFKQAHTYEQHLCSHCGHVFASAPKLKRHLENMHTKPYSCDVCGMGGFGSSYNVIQHKRRVHTDGPVFLCSDCGQGFKTKEPLIYHVQRYHQTTPTACKCCKSVFPSKLQCSSHQSKCFAQSDGMKEGAEFACDICDKAFTSRQKMEDHVNIHTGLKPYCCGDCGKCYASRSCLYVHRRDKHGKKFTCDVCNKNLTSKQSMKDHVNIHKGLKPYCCDVCGKCFSSRNYLYIHRKGHVEHKGIDHAERKICNTCGRDYANMASLKTHMYHTHKQKSLPVCDICNAVFTYKGNLIRHMKTHGAKSDAYTPIRNGITKVLVDGVIRPAKEVDEEPYGGRRYVKYPRKKRKGTVSVEYEIITVTV